MSQQNVEIVRQGIEAWNAGGMDRLRELYDADAVCRQPSDWIGGPWVGREAIMERFRELRGVHGEDSFGSPELLDAGDRVVVRVPWHSDTRGLALTTELTYVHEIRNGLIVGLEYFNSWEERSKPRGWGLGECRFERFASVTAGWERRPQGTSSSSPSLSARPLLQCAIGDSNGWRGEESPSGVLQRDAGRSWTPRASDRQGMANRRSRGRATSA